MDVHVPWSMSEIESSFEDMLRGNDAPPVREGLPPTYRMRASSHYVEQLDSEILGSPVRHLDVTTIDLGADGAQPAVAFIESVRHHGILQPLLVQKREGRYRLLAGRQRLLAARAAGLNEVPCIVHRVNDLDVERLSVASNVPSTEAVEASAPAGADAATRELAHGLSALASSANLLSRESTLTNHVAMDLVKAEAARALQLLLATRVLRSDMSGRKSVVAVSTIIEQAVRSTAAERQLRGLDLRVEAPAGEADIHGDGELLAGAVGALLVAVGALNLSGRARHLTLKVSAATDAGRVVFWISREGVTLPDSRLSRLFDGGTVDGSDDAIAPVVLAARRIARWHGGETAAVVSERHTSLTLSIPAVTRGV